MATAPQEAELSWSARDLIIYALGIGLGSTPAEVDYVWEERLTPLPTFLATLARTAGLVRATGVDFSKVVQLEQRARFHRPLPVEGALTVRHRIAGAYDKGERGVVLDVRSELLSSSDGAPLASLDNLMLARGDRHVGGGSSPAEAAVVMPTRDPDATVEIATRPDQALLYRLCGDLNPLHVDAAYARSRGFEGPILHGLCAYGIALRAVLQSRPGSSASAVRAHRTAFRAPVYPGETLAFDIWNTSGESHFQARARERGLLVLDGGLTSFSQADD